MNTVPESRASERQDYTTPIVFSYSNKKHLFNAQTLNHCAGGVGFKPNVFLQPGITLYIRVKELHLNGSYTGRCKGLRSVTLAEVKWCKEISDSDRFSDVLGTKHFQPDY